MASFSNQKGMNMHIVEFLKEWKIAIRDKTFMIVYCKNLFKISRKWQLTRHRKAVLINCRFGHVHFDRYFSFMHFWGSMEGHVICRLGIDLYIHLGAGLGIYHTKSLEKLGRAYTEQESPQLRL